MLRDFCPDDHEHVRELILAGLQEHWGTLDESLNPDLNDLTTFYDSGCILVLEEEGEILATGTVVPRGDDAAEVVRMSVDSNLRRRGLGRQVLEGLVEVAASWGISEIVLETSAAWTGTVAFYESCGFTVTHENDGECGLDRWFVRQL